MTLETLRERLLNEAKWLEAQVDPTFREIGIAKLLREAADALALEMDGVPSRR